MEHSFFQTGYRSCSLSLYIYILIIIYLSIHIVVGDGLIIVSYYLFSKKIFVSNYPKVY